MTKSAWSVFVATVALSGCGASDGTSSVPSGDGNVAPPASTGPAPSATTTATAAPTQTAPPAASSSAPVPEGGAVPLSGPASDAGLQVPAYDPSVAFEWPETVPNQGECKAGVYVGQFNCQYADPTNPAQPPIDVAGPVNFTLQESANGEFLEIADGHLDGSAFILLPFTADLTGNLDCSTNAFSAQAVNGFSPATTFTGTLDGTLDRSTQTLSGTWSMLPDTVSGSCDGPWSAVRQP